MNVALAMGAPGMDAGPSVVILFGSALFLLASLYAFAHARVQSADFEELERLQRQGLLQFSADAAEDFRGVCQLLAEIAPAVYLRQEIWIRVYFHSLCWVRKLRRYRSTANCELRYLAAYQANLYRIACLRLENLHT